MGVRRAFEAYAKADHLNLEKDTDGEYADDYTAQAWAAWRAAIKWTL